MIVVVGLPNLLRAVLRGVRSEVACVVLGIATVLRNRVTVTDGDGLRWPLGLPYRTIASRKRACARSYLFISRPVKPRIGGPYRLSRQSAALRD